MILSLFKKKWRIKLNFAELILWPSLNCFEYQRWAPFPSLAYLWKHSTMHDESWIYNDWIVSHRVEEIHSHHEWLVEDRSIEWNVWERISWLYYECTELNSWRIKKRLFLNWGRDQKVMPNVNTKLTYKSALDYLKLITLFWCAIFNGKIH